MQELTIPKHGIIQMKQKHTKNILIGTLKQQVQKFLFLFFYLAYNAQINTRFSQYNLW